jgi:hypothetical protein
LRDGIGSRAGDEAAHWIWCRAERQANVVGHINMTLPVGDHRCR